jgi:hypothetical protein
VSKITFILKNEAGVRRRVEVEAPASRLEWRGVLAAAIGPDESIVCYDDRQLNPNWGRS